jgi:hypothetical protein
METLNRKNIAWHENCLPPKTRKALHSLVDAEWLKRDAWYLAGGTALTLQVGHRSSVDLDFFTQQQDFVHQSIIKHFTKNAWKSDILREGTLYGELYGAKISFIAYPFFVPRRKFHFYGDVPVLDERDIAVMKIIAISQRGRKRDFIDLFWLCKNRESLIDIMRRLPDQYPNVAHDYHHIIKSLTYFKDADEDPMPEILFTAPWSEVKKFFQKESKMAAKQLLLR